MKLRFSSLLFLAPSLLCLPACEKLAEHTNTKLHLSSSVVAAGQPGRPHSDRPHPEGAHAQGGHVGGSQKESGHNDVGHGESGHGELAHKIIVTSPVARSVVSTQSYVCQIHSCRHIEIRALESGYLEEVPLKEGQMVQQGQSMFRVVPALYQARLETELAEAQLVQIEYNNAKKLFDQRVVSAQEVALAQAKLSKAEAQVRLSQAELNFANVKAPFTGIIDRLHCQQGSLVAEGDVLTTLSDNSVMWVYFNVPESRYLEYQASAGRDQAKLHIELMLANHTKFDQPGKIGAIEAEFNNETGNIAFRADFPNPTGLLRHGQTGNILIHTALEGATVIPQRATFEILAKRYVFIVDAENVVHQREITIETEMEDIFVIKDGVQPGEKIILEGIRQVRDGERIDFEFRDPVEVLGNLKNKAE